MHVPSSMTLPEQRFQFSRFPNFIQVPQTFDKCITTNRNQPVASELFIWLVVRMKQPFGCCNTHNQYRYGNKHTDSESQATAASALHRPTRGRRQQHMEPCTSALPIIQDGYLPSDPDPFITCENNPHLCRELNKLQHNSGLMQHICT